MYKVYSKLFEYMKSNFHGEKTGQVIDRDITLYAVWLDTEAKEGQLVEFYIRLDNQIPFEPTGYHGIPMVLPSIQRGIPRVWWEL